MHLSNVSPELAAWWHPVGVLDEIGDGPARVELLGRAWVVVRLGGELAAFPDRCPHRGARLSVASVIAGESETASLLQCAYHGWCFDDGGRCVEIPSIGGPPPGGERFHLRPAAGVCEAFGLLWLAPEPPQAPVLPFAEWDDASFVVDRLSVKRMKTGAAQLMENNLDVAHIPFVHKGTFGLETELPKVGDLKIERDGWTLSMSHPIGLEGGRWHKEQTAAQVSHVGAPFMSSLRVDLPDGRVDAYYQAIQPEDLTTSVVYQFIATNEPGDDETRRQSIKFNEMILDEDMWILAQVDDPELSLDATKGDAHVPMDRAGLAYRRLLADLVKSCQAVS